MKFFHFIISGILILLIGFLSGYILGFVRAKIFSFPEIRLVEDTNEGVATLKLLEVKNGRIRGELAGRDARVAYNTEDILTLEPGDTFEIPMNEINLRSYYQARDLPENALFIASKKGKYYYSIFDAQAYRIAERNRIYFESAAEAEAQGYIKKE